LSLLLFLLAASLGSCIVPEVIEQQSDAGPDIVAAPVITEVSPSLAIDCLDDSTVDSTNSMYSYFSVYIEDAAGMTTPPTQLTSRWFVNYDPLDSTTQNYTIDGPYSPDTIFYPPFHMTAPQLSIRARGYGVYVVQVVIADKFDDTLPPLHQAPPTGDYATSYKWVVRYIAGEGSCPP
jgi:hypothetical protein